MCWQKALSDEQISKKLIETFVRDVKQVRWFVDVDHGSRGRRLLRLAGAGGGRCAARQRARDRQLQRAQHPDAAAAKAFYGAVFGWRTLDLGGGVEMWRLDGYGDHLEEIQPGTRKAVEESGGPEGFEDVVASLNPIGDDQPDTPAHWSVTFAVDDADAIAARATELGGRVLMPPFDAPWVRMTVLADPQGATFIASKFVPENKDL